MNEILIVGGHGLLIGVCLSVLVMGLLKIFDPDDRRGASLLVSSM